MFCTKCGTNNEDSNAFCKNCGAKLVRPAANSAGGGLDMKYLKVAVPVAVSVLLLFLVLSAVGGKKSALLWDTKLNSNGWALDMKLVKDSSYVAKNDLIEISLTSSKYKFDIEESSDYYAYLCDKTGNDVFSIIFKSDRQYNDEVVERAEIIGIKIDKYKKYTRASWNGGFTCYYPISGTHIVVVLRNTEYMPDSEIYDILDSIKIKKKN